MTRVSWNPLNDGVDHLNIYSKGKTVLGRWLSNFAREPMITLDGRFDSVEGYWYWLRCRDDKLRTLSGFSAKEFGRAQEHLCEMSDADFQSRIIQSLAAKSERRPDMLATLRSNSLPLTHYYVFNGVATYAGYEWLTAAWQHIAAEAS